MCAASNGDVSIVETGSYHGKTTVLFGTVLKYFSGTSKVYSIDIHDGKQGATDLGLKTYAPSYEFLKRNIERSHLTNVVVAIKDHSWNVQWHSPISLLFIDGLHDYPNVARDFWHFEEWLVPGGYAVFHDYADYYPGVRAFVNDLMNSGNYSRIKLVDSLIVLKKNEVRVIHIVKSKKKTFLTRD